MSEKIKYSYKELRGPDKFRQILADGIDLASNHFNKILIAIGLLFLILFVSYVFSTINKKKDIMANIEFQDALQTYNNGQILESLEKFEKVNKNFASRDISALSLYYMGIINYDLEYDVTIQNLKDFLQKDIKDIIVKDSAILTIGLSYFNLKKWDESIEYLTKINDESSPYFNQAMLHLGMSYEKTGNYEKSEQIYKEILSKKGI